jgi:hypothetical protein
MESEFLLFLEWPRGLLKKKKTKRFTIKSKSSGVYLAEIRWYGPWRQYCFFPKPETIFNVTCMGDISNFIRQLMEERKRDAAVNPPRGA